MKKTWKTREFYPTWQEASVAAIALGIVKKTDYDNSYLKDKRLPSNPYAIYKDFPGFAKFLGNSNRHRGSKKSDFYKTWQEAISVAIGIGVKTESQYRVSYHLDSRLPSCLYYAYKDFPGFPKAMTIICAKSSRIKLKKAS